MKLLMDNFLEQQVVGKSRNSAIKTSNGEEHKNTSKRNNINPDLTSLQNFARVNFSCATILFSIFLGWPEWSFQRSRLLSCWEQEGVKESWREKHETQQEHKEAKRHRIFENSTHYKLLLLQERSWHRWDIAR